MPTKNFSELITFTRASPATYYDANEVLQTAAIDEPRLTYDPETGEALGFLIEEGRTRLNTIAAAPTNPENVTVTGVAHAISFFGTGTVNLTGVATETLVGTGASDRVTLTFTPTAGTLTITPSGTVENLQLEAGSFSTSPITWDEGSQATRGADSCTRTLGAEFNPDEFTVFFDFDTFEDGVTRIDLSIDKDSLQRIQISKPDGSTNRIFAAVNGSSRSFNFSASDSVKGAFTYNSVTGFTQAAMNGESVQSANLNAGAEFDSFRIGNGFNEMLPIAKGVYRYCRIYPRALTQTELEELTAP